jgi:cytochrome o ubiquinol oxidase operon protein cyoD
MTNATPTETRDTRTYLTGFVLALILTAIPFALVYFELVSRGVAIAAIAILALIQVVVHLRFFLHIDFKRTPKENLLAMAFAGFLIIVMVGGSLLIMFDLHYRMMVM